MSDPLEYYQDAITFILDGERVTLRNVSPRTLLVDYLHSVGRTGTKLVCGEGGCGACTVMLSDYDQAGRLVHRAINACLRPLCAIDGAVVTTTQGLGSVATTLDPVQFKIAANNGSQCGYCTPGFVMSMYTLLQNEAEPTEQQVEDNFDGHICRCTGYRPILEGFRQFAVNYEPPENPAKICAQLGHLSTEYDPLAYPPTDPVCLHCAHDDSHAKGERPGHAPCTAADHFEKVKLKAHRVEIPAGFESYMKEPQPLYMSVDDITYVRPLELEDAVRLKGQYNTKGFPAFKLLVGNTAAAILKTIPRYEETPADPGFLLDISAIPALQRAELSDDGITIGGAVTISQLMALLRQAIEERSSVKTRGYRAFLDHLERVGNNQVRNVAAVAGNIWLAKNGGDPSDLLTVMGVLDATVTVISEAGRTEYHIMDLPPDKHLHHSAIYESFNIPFTAPLQHVRSYKAMFRHQNAYPIVNAAFMVKFDRSRRVRDARIVLNGIAGDYTAQRAKFGLNGFAPTRPSATETFLRDKAWSEQTLADALVVLAGELEALRPSDNKVIDAIPFDYRKQIGLDYFYKFFVAIAMERSPGDVPAAIRSAGRPFQRPISRGEQIYNDYPDELPVSLPLIKLSAFAQASGEAKYTHNAQQPPGTLEAAYVYSLVPRGTFHYRLPTGRNVSLKRLIAHLRDEHAGFVDYVTYADIPAPEHNWAGLGGDDPIFVPSEEDDIPASVMRAARSDHFFRPAEASCIGAPIGLVVATDQRAAREIAAFVRNQCIVFNRLDAVLDLDQAIAERRFFPQNPPTDPVLNHIEEITRPGSDKAWLKDHSSAAGGMRTVSGRQYTGFQQHFYLETMGTLAIPDENRTITLYTSTQTLADNQSAAAAALGIPANQVRVILRRDGGGFGGKQTRSRFNSTATAVAAAKLQRPVRLVLSLNDNFIMCGERHPFRGDYRVAFDDDGRIHGVDLDLYSNGGCTYDVSFPVMDLAMLLSDNGYQIDTYRVTGNVARTNQLSNTAFRTFGGVQAINIVETIIERVGHETGIAPENIREQHLYRNGNFEWTAFEVTAQTVAVMESYGLSAAELAPLQGHTFEDQRDFERAVKDALPDLPVSTLRLLEEHSTTSYDFTPYLQGLKYCDIRRIWDDLKESSDFERRAARVETFNASSRWRKRGIAMIPLKYGVAYTGPRGTLDQGGAYVIAYAADGSVLVQHGGVEIGQGIQTKMAQIAAETLGIPLDYIRMGDTDTQVISDASPTAASTGSDLNGGAVQKACRQLRRRLEDFCENLEQYTAFFDPGDVDVAAVVDNWRERWPEVWSLVVKLAYVNRINLSAQARYKTPHYAAVDVAHPHGRPFFYYTYAVGASEVEIDVLTGEYTILRSDILFDVGKSLNPLIDIGQIEGGFIQGVGYLTMENLLLQTGNEAPKKGYPEGAILSYGTWKYKPPESKSIPLEFYVSLVDNTGRTLEHAGPRLDPTAVKSSKGIGEPPLILGNSVFFAIRRAVAAARRDQGRPEWFQFDAPATISRIQQACAVDIASLNLS